MLHRLPAHGNTAPISPSPSCHRPLLLEKSLPSLLLLHSLSRDLDPRNTRLNSRPLLPTVIEQRSSPVTVQIPALVHGSVPTSRCQILSLLNNAESNPIERAAESNARARICTSTKIDKRHHPECTIASPADLAEVPDGWSQHRAVCDTVIVRGSGVAALLDRRIGVAAHLSVCRVMAAFACSGHACLLEQGAAAAFCRVFAWCSSGQEELDGTNQWDLD